MVNRRKWQGMTIIGRALLRMSCHVYLAFVTIPELLVSRIRLTSKILGTSSSVLRAGDAMKPRWEQVDEFLWRTPLQHGWLYRNVRDCETYYEPDPEKGWTDSKWRLGGKRTPDVHILAIEGDILQSVDIANSVACTAWAN